MCYVLIGEEWNSDDSSDGDEEGSELCVGEGEGYICHLTSLVVVNRAVAEELEDSCDHRKGDATE